MKAILIILLCLAQSVNIMAQNIALGKGCNSSSSNGTQTCGKAFDGVRTPASKWVSSGATAESWISVDLGQTYNITSVNVVNAGAVGENTQYNTRLFRIETQNANGTWAIRKLVDNSSLLNTVTVNLSSLAVTARSIRLYITQPNNSVDQYSRIAEFEVYGNVPGTAMPPCAGNLNLNGTITGTNVCNGTLTVTNIITSGITTLVAPTVSITGTATIGSGCNIVAGSCTPNTDPCFVTRSGNTFAYKGGEFRFIGVNIQDLAYRDNGYIDQQLASARQMGVRVVRIFLPQKDFSTQVIGDKLQNLLNRISAIAPAIKLLISLTNYYNDGGYLPAGDEAFYYQAPNSTKVTLHPDWFTIHYPKNYLPFIGAIASRFKADNRIFAWELGNEIKAGNATNMLDFAYKAGWYLRANVKVQQMISTGFIGVRHACNGEISPELINKMYVNNGANGTSPFSFGSIHTYNNEQINPAENATCNGYIPQLNFHDINWFNANNYPYIVGEAGFDGAFNSGNRRCGTLFGSDCKWENTVIPGAGSSRKGALQATMDKFFNEKGCDGFMNWGFADGQGDNCSGFEKTFHTDWDELYQMYSSKAASLPSGGTSCTAAPIAAGNIYDETPVIVPNSGMHGAAVLPNPFGNELQIVLPNASFKQVYIVLYGSNGSNLLRKTVQLHGNTRIRLDTRTLPAGTCICVVYNDAGEIILRQKLVKQ
jgi:hypothetical protein